MSLSPYVTPFVPKPKSAGESNGFSSWKLSAETSEFVPSWLDSKTTLLHDHIQNNHDVKKNAPNTKKQKASSSNINNLTNSSKIVKNYRREEINSDSEFPALGVPVKNEQRLHAVRYMQFGVSFSDKLKSNRSSSYFYDEPPKQFQDMRLKEQGNLSVGHEDCKNEAENEETGYIKGVNRNPSGVVTGNEEFTLPKNKSKKIQKTKSSHIESLAWKSEVHSEKEPRTCETEILNYEGNKRARQTSKQQKDYYAFSSTYEVSDLESRNTSIKERLSDSMCNVSTTGGNAFTDKSRLPLSYSDVLRRKPDHPEMLKGNERGTLKIPSEEEGNDKEVEEQQETTKKKKRKKKKKSTGEAQQPQPVKKSKEALTLDFGDMFAKIMESSSTKKKPILRTGGMLPAQAPLPPKETRTTKKSEVQVSNTLDSTAPIVFHSKEREVPKKKKPSAMRKTLMKDREEKKRAQEANNELNSEEQISEEELMESNDIDPAEIKKAIHSRKFREYCDHDLDYDINGVVIQLLKELIRFQDRLFHKDPVKAKARRRFVCGLREVHKHAKLKKLKCVIVTPNLEPTKSKGGLDDLLSNIIDVCHSQNVPVVFSLNRQVLGRVLLKKVPVSIVGIFYYDGAQDYFKRLMTLTEVARETYKDKFNKAREKFILEKQMAKDLAFIEAGLESTKIQKVKDEMLKHNESAENTVDVSIEIAEQNAGRQSKVEK